MVERMIINWGIYIISLIIIVNIFIAGMILISEKREIGSTWAWLLVLFFIPVLGFLVYLFLGRKLNKPKLDKWSTKEKEHRQSIADKEINRLQRSNFNDNNLLKKYSKLILMNVNSSTALVTLNNEVTIFSNGQEKFSSLFNDIREAKKEINIQYYIIQPDQLGEKLRNKLIIKAKEGVKVRVLYDQIGSKKMNLSFFNELISNGGEVQCFFCSFLKFINFRINNRNHRKLCIIDGDIAYIGGFNVGNEYLGLNKEFGYWRDTHIRVRGKCVHDIQGKFIFDWNKTSKQNCKYEKPSDQYQGNSPVQIIAGGPNCEIENIKNTYIKLIMSAKRSVHIQTPYFIPDTSFMDACKISLLAGIDIQIMIPSKGDGLFVYPASMVYAGELLKYGAKILLYEKGFLHAKTIIVDQEIVSVGSANFDIRSFKLNYEANIMIYDKNVAEQLECLFMEDRNVCSEFTLERYQERSLLFKYKEGVSRLLSPIL
jgi:cardiolipin synthase